MVASHCGVYLIIPLMTLVCTWRRKVLGKHPPVSSFESTSSRWPATAASFRQPDKYTLVPTMAFFSKPQSSSSAVKIVNPAHQDDHFKHQPRKGSIHTLFFFILQCPSCQSRSDSVQRQCRNTLIYGYVSPLPFRAPDPCFRLVLNAPPKVL